MFRWFLGGVKMKEKGMQGLGMFVQPSDNKMKKINSPGIPACGTVIALSPDRMVNPLVGILSSKGRKESDMAVNFKLNTSKKDKERIVISMSGDFDGMSAWELIHKMREYEGMCELIEVNTNGLKELIPFGRNVLMANAKPSRKSRSRYVVTGLNAAFFSDFQPFETMRP